MDTLVPEATLKGVVLRAIGRNLISLQRLEKLLKGLAGLRPVAGKLPDITTELKRRQKRTSVSTLGIAISQWLETARGGEPTAPAISTDQDVLVSFWLQLPIPQDVLDEHAKELGQILTERNWLVHKGLTEIDFDSNEDCGNLMARLDEQQRRVIKQIEWLRPIVNQILEFNEFVTREDIQQIIKREMLMGETSE